MGSNSFGNLFRFTTFGESHGSCIGVVIDGCPAGVFIEKDGIEAELARRRPGKHKYTSKRDESDEVKILSGVFEGYSTGAPICLLIENQDADSSKYDSIKDLLRPGHANFTYLEKYGIFDYRGGGRSSGRETAARVAAGAIAKKFLGSIMISAFIDEVGGQKEEEQINKVLEKALEEGDSLGGVIGCSITNVPIGLGDPIYEKIEARLASAMMSIPATKGVEFGEGFQAAKMRGSQHNDAFIQNHEGETTLASNTHGGMLGGITTGMPIVFRVAFKPTSSIQKPQKSVDIYKQPRSFVLPKGSRHDPCIALRAPAIVEAMAALVLADSILMNRCSKI